MIAVGTSTTVRAGIAEDASMFPVSVVDAWSLRAADKVVLVLTPAVQHKRQRGGCISYTKYLDCPDVVLNHLRKGQRKTLSLTFDSD